MIFGKSCSIETTDRRPRQPNKQMNQMTLQQWSLQVNFNNKDIIFATKF
jgi:hypothetical protein